MCDVLWLDGREIETPNELAAAGYEPVPAPHWVPIYGDGCLCQVDILASVRDRALAYDPETNVWSEFENDERREG